jgi:hypothetical protein
MEQDISIESSISWRMIPWPVGLSFVGQYAATNFYCFHVISKVLMEYPNLGSIIELGTFAGVMTMYLGLWGAKLGIPVHTFDFEPNLSKDVWPVFEKLGIQTHWIDIYSERGIREVLDAVGKEPTYLVCDGGDKPREIGLFPRMLPTGSVVSVHDWGDEIKELDTDTLQLYINSEDWVIHDAKLATFVILGDAEEAKTHLSDEERLEMGNKWAKLAGREEVIPKRRSDAFHGADDSKSIEPGD